MILNPPPHTSAGTDQWLGQLTLHWTELADTRLLVPNLTSLTSRDMLVAIIGHDLDTLMAFCLENGLPVDYRDEQDRLLPWACAFGSLRIATLLIASGADLNYVDGDNETPLSSAASSGNLELVSYLVQKAKLADHIEGSQHAVTYINYNFQGITALQVAAENGHADIVSFLVREGADVWVRDERQQTPLFDAILWCPTAVGAILAAVDPAKLVEYVNVVDVLGDTAIHRVAMWGDPDDAHALVEAGASVTIRNNKGRTPLIEAAAAEIDRLAIVKYLIDAVDREDKHDYVNARDNKGETALRWAAFNGHHDVTQLLIDQGALDSILDNVG